VAVHKPGEAVGGIIASADRVPLEDASFLRAVLEAIPAFVVRVDPERRITYINHLRGGLTLDQVIGRPVREFIAPDDSERFEHAVAEALRTGKVCKYTVKGSHSVNSRGAAHYEGQAVPMDNGDGRRTVCFVVSDVSEQVERAHALARSEEKLRVAVEATGIGLWTWDVENDRVDWDERMVELVGSAPMSTREYLARVVHPDDRARMAGEIGDAGAGRPSFLEHRIVRPDGQVRWFLPCGRISKDEQGRVARMTGGTLDVTAQRLFDERLRKAQKLDAVGSLTAGVTHNFNNMLAVIIPALELSLRRAPPGETQMIEDAMHAARRATELVSQLMTFAGQRGALEAEPHDLAKVLERAASMCRRTFERQVRLETGFDDCGPVACDPMAIEQVAVNLLINARDAVIESARVDPQIRLELSETLATRPDAPGRKPERYARIRVQDNGVGMAEAVKQRLFEPFFTTKPAGKGTGLGLATSYGIVRDHGGFITFESQAGAGSTAAVFLPLTREATAHAHASAARALRARPGTILVVDDEPAVRRVVELLLGARGHTIHAAADGQSAIAALDRGLQPDVILLDRSMPGWPVRMTLEQIRRRAPRVPIVFFTGQDVPSEERALVQDVLLKPLATDALVQSVERWLAPQA
jgi:PAS domain S-box-containing protein